MPSLFDYVSALEVFGGAFVGHWLTRLAWRLRRASWKVKP